MVRDEMLQRVREGPASEDKHDLQEEMQKAAQEDTEEDTEQVIFDDE